MNKSWCLRHVGWAILFCIIIVLCINGFLLHHFFSENSDPEEISGTWNNPANAKQYVTSVKMGVSDQRLYILMDNTLYFLNGGHLDKVVSFDGFVIDIIEDYVYYITVSPELSCHVYSYHISDSISNSLITTRVIGDRTCYLQDGVMYIPADDECSLYYPIYGDRAGDPVANNEQYEIAGNMYSLEYEKGRKELVCYDQNGAKVSMSSIVPYGIKSLIPCNNGLLIHNEGQGNLLYFIEEDTGQLIELFAVECMMSISAVNVYQSNVYLTFCRFEKHGQIGMVGYENDILEGTYRINLSDYSVEKLSDAVYDGLYIFDDTGIYACADECIYKLDFDGNIIKTLLE